MHCHVALDVAMFVLIFKYDCIWLQKIKVQLYVAICPDLKSRRLEQVSCRIASLMLTSLHFTSLTFLTAVVILHATFTRSPVKVRLKLSKYFCQCFNLLKLGRLQNKLLNSEAYNDRIQIYYSGSQVSVVSEYIWIYLYWKETIIF